MTGTSNKQYSIVDYQGLKYHYSSIGSNFPVVMLLHGLRESSDYWLPIFDTALADKLNIIIPDLPGFGLSVLNSQIFPLEEAHIRIAEIAQRHEMSSLTMIGHSMGATIATLVHQQLQFSPKQLIIIDGLLVEETENTSSYGSVNHFIEADLFKQHMLTKLLPVIEQNAFMERYYQNIMAMSPDVLYEWAKTLVSLLGNNAVYHLLESMPSKPQFIYGTKSINERNIKAAESLNLKTYALKGVGHWPMLEAPNQFWDIIGKIIE